jgi:hypothetical protein
MKLALLFPPATDPRSPHLAIPALTAYLRQNGVKVVQMDLDIEGLLALLRPDSLAHAIQRLQSGSGKGFNPERWEILVRLSEGLPERVENALGIIQDPVRFFNSNDFNAARAVLDTAVAVVSSSSAVPLEYSLAPIRYDVQGYETRRLHDLVSVTQSPENNLFHLDWEENALPRLDSENPNLVGISLTNRQQLIPGLTLARRLKERGHFVVLGGTLVTKFADILTHLPEFFRIFANGVIVFEGETALLELVAQLERGHDFSRVPNFRYLDGDVVRATAAHAEDVDALPTPDFEGLPLGGYLVPRPVLPILFGKGCYHSRCNFCDIPHINRVSGLSYRRRGPEKVVADIRHLEERFGAIHFVITDESLAPEVLCQVAEAFGPDSGRYSFTGYARLEPGFTPEVCRRIAEMGIKKLFFGLESAAQRTLDHMNKGFQVGAAPAVLRACREAGIGFHLFSMIGLPEENEASARETLAFLLDHSGIIDHPGNSFDIHPFGLDVRARYFKDRDRYGLSVAPAVLRQELVISLSHDDWQNTRGLPNAKVGELLEEFNSKLLRTYSRYHNGPRPLWPPFEEHAVLYGDHFRTKPFPYSATLPVNAEGERFYLQLSPACVRDGADGVVKLTSHWGTFDIPASMCRALEHPLARTVNELVSACVSVTPDHAARAEYLVRELVQDLIGKGVLQLELADTNIGGAYSPSRSSGASA